MLSTTMHLLSEKKKREKLHNETFSILKPCDVWPFFVVKSVMASGGNLSKMKGKYNNSRVI